MGTAFVVFFSQIAFALAERCVGATLLGELSVETGTQATARPRPALSVAELSADLGGGFLDVGGHGFDEVLGFKDAYVLVI